MKRIIIRAFCVCILISGVWTVNVQAYSAYGSKGSEVAVIQAKLSDLGYYHLKCDGMYGTATVTAVKEYQKDKGLVSDGIAGRKTLSSLNIINEYEINLLAAVINGEARGESFRGQVAVGAVVLNRVEHPAFPDTVSGVVYQKGAFSAVKD